MSMLFALALQAAQQPLQSPRISQSTLDGITDSCRAPRQWLGLRGKEIVIRADPNANAVKIRCVLKKVDAVLEKANTARSGAARASEEK